MKKFTKLFLSCAAVTAITASLAVSAMAAGEVTADWTQATKTLKVTANYDASQKTLLVLPKNVSLTNVTQDDIIQIGQEAAFENAEVALPADLEDGTYTVWMGGDETPYSDDFYIGEGQQILVGNVNMDAGGTINGIDARAVLKHAVAVEGSADILTGAKFEAAAQCNKLGDTTANGIDARFILMYSVSTDPENDPSLQKAGVGKTITVSAQ